MSKPIPEIAHAVDWDNLTDEEVDRALEIVQGFVSWNEETGPCPIELSNRFWFKRLCALGEWIAMLETKVETLEARGAYWKRRARRWKRRYRSA